MRMRWFKAVSRTRSTLAVCLVPLLAAVGRTSLHAQADPGERLQALVRAEQVALEANDPAQILTSAKQLGSVALQLLGALYTGEGKCAPAGDAYRRSLAVMGETADPQERLATSVSLLTAELCADHEAEAGQVGRSIVAMAGDTDKVHMLLANAHHTAGDLPGTIAALKQAVALNPSSGFTHLALGNAYWELNEYQYNPDTLEEFTLAQKQLPDDFNTNENLGSVLSQYQRYDEATTYLQKAAAEDPRSPSPWLQMGMNAYEQGRREEARTALKKAEALTGSNESLNGYQIRRGYAALSRLAAQSGDAAEAEAYAQREKKLHAAMRGTDATRPLTESTGAVAIDNVAPGGASEKRSQAGSSATADDQLVRQLNEIVAKSLNDAGTVLARSHEYASAMPLFQIASTADPELQPVMRNLGLAAFHAGDFRTAVDALSHALQQRPDDALVQNDLAQSRAMLSGQAAPR